jgi:hypothetical protein
MTAMPFRLVRNVLCSLAIASSAAWAQASPSESQDTQQTATPAPKPESTQAAAPDSTASAPATETAAQPQIPAVAKFPVTSGGEVGVYSHYMWRGFLLTDAVSTQPTYWVKFGDITVSSWMNVAGGQVTGPLTEHDLTVDYSKALDKWTLSVGWINYVFPGAEDRVSNEIYAGASYATFLNPTVKVYQDVHAGTGTYVNLSVNHPVPLGSSGFIATPSFGIGYNHEQWIDDSAWSDLNFGVKVLVPTPSPRVAFTPAIYYSKSLIEDVLPDQLYGGVGIVVRF